MLIRLLYIENFLGVRIADLATLYTTKGYFYFYIAGFSRQRYERTRCLFAVEFGKSAEFHFDKMIGLQLFGRRWVKTWRPAAKKALV